MELRLTETAIEELRFFHKTGQKAILKKIEVLLSEMEQNPFSGTGKPEPLKHNLSGLWSRRINREHRIIYEIGENTVFILSVKGHY